jgi:DNA polymerase III subunit gamma/tau
MFNRRHLVGMVIACWNSSWSPKKKKRDASFASQFSRTVGWQCGLFLSAERSLLSIIAFDLALIKPYTYPMPVLYRTYRPSKWSEVIGQDHIVDALKESISSKRIAHAYLFNGTRGTGKTTVARIVAHELKTADEDINEIDAASNRGIDDIRALREHVSTLPFSSQYKVYIIDEVHMLSKDAWNALLKTLEEPPAHVVFILATTELDKVPDTIISRCQAFTFRTPTRDMLGRQIASVARKEGYALDPGAADLIALLGDGSFRDALGMLEKVIGASGEGSGGKASDTKITRAAVEAITGAPRAELVNAFASAIVSRNANEALAVLSAAEEIGVAVPIFLTLVLEKLRFILLAQHSVDSHDLLTSRVSADDWAFIRSEAGKKALSPQSLSILLEAVDGVSRARISALPLELAVVTICQ